MRLNAAICQELDLIARQDWQQTLHQQYQNQLRAMEMVNQLAGKKSLRQRDRTPAEEQSALRKHEENLLSSPREQDKLHAAVYGGELWTQLSYPKKEHSFALYLAVGRVKRELL